MAGKAPRKGVEWPRGSSQRGALRVGNRNLPKMAEQPAPAAAKPKGRTLACFYVTKHSWKGKSVTGPLASLALGFAWERVGAAGSICRPHP